MAKVIKLHAISLIIYVLPCNRHCFIPFSKDLKALHAHHYNIGAVVVVFVEEDAKFRSLDDLGQSVGALLAPVPIRLATPIIDGFPRSIVVAI